MSFSYTDRVRTPLDTRSLRFLDDLAPAVLTLDAVVRLARDEGPQSPADAVDRVPADSPSADAWRGCRDGVDGGHQACDHFR